MSQRAGDTVIMVQCLRCKHRGALPDELLAQFGVKPGAPISSFVKRLRCLKCGSGSVAAQRVRSKAVGQQRRRA